MSATMMAELTLETRAQLNRIEALLVRVLAPKKPSFDPKVFSDPRDWGQESFKERPFSECPPDYLELSATMYLAFAEKAEREKATLKNGGSKAEWNTKLAKAAQDWANYNRAIQPAKPTLDDELSGFPGGL